MSLFLSFLFISKYSGFVNTQQRNGNKHTNWHFMFTKVSRICTNLGQSQMLHHFIGICEWTVIISNGFFSCSFLSLLLLWLITNSLTNRLIERTEYIKIFEVDKCRDIFNHQNRLQIFFPKQNICAGHSSGQPIKIVIFLHNI